MQFISAIYVTSALILAAGAAPVAQRSGVTNPITSEAVDLTGAQHI